MMLAIAKVRKTHLTHLVRMINSTHNEVDLDFIVPEEEGIIKTKRVGCLKIIELQMESPNTLALLEALESLDRY